jgi:hypothetical protein
VTHPPADRSFGDGADPHVTLLDARQLGVDSATLRTRARSLTAASGAPFVSRSYRFPYALAGWHCGPIGIDIEQIGPLDSDFADLICTPDEQSELVSVDDRDTYLTSLWCSKEALGKALGDALLYEPGRLEAPVRWPLLRSGPWRAWALDVEPTHVAWVCWRIPDRFSATDP